MISLSSNLLRVAGLALALPMLGMCSAIAINGSCVTGSCPGTALTSPGSTSGSYSTNFSVNGDSFSLYSTYGATFPSGTTISADPTVTYTGSGLSKNDIVTLDFYQTYSAPGASGFAGTYHEYVPLTLGANTSALVDLYVDGSGIGAVTASGPGSYYFTNSAYETAAGSLLTYDYKFTFTFNGAATGTMASSTPEPAEIIPAGLSLIGFALVALRRRKQSMVK